MKGLLTRSFLSVAAVAAFGVFNAAWNATATVAAGDLTAMQMDNSNVSYVASRTGNHMLGNGELSGLLLLGILVAIWWRPLRNVFAPGTAALLLLAGAMGAVAVSTPAQAYFSKYDYAEVYYIQPNESAFYIPDVGANLNSQAKFGSVAYYEADKVASKRFEIKHVKLPDSGTLTDYYVPAGRLIVVDRTPYYREWVGSAMRGTSKTDQEFRFESADSLGIHTGVVISALVTEEDAAKFLYYFGTEPSNINPSDPASQFVSVIHGKSLAEVMDHQVRGAVQAALATQFGSRTLVDGYSNKSAIIKAVEADVIAKFKPMGITITYLGYADQLGYEPVVQKAINDVFIASMKAKEAIELTPALPALQTQTNMEVERAAVWKWDGKTFPNVPNWLFITSPSEMWATVKGWFAADATPTVKH